MKNILIIILFILLPVLCLASDPDCTGKDRWPASMAFGALKNAGITDNSKIDFSKTEVVRLASEKIGKDLFRQVHKIIFTEHGGKTIVVITINNVSSVECSEGAVEVYIISKHIGASGSE